MYDSLYHQELDPTEWITHIQWFFESEISDLEAFALKSPCYNLSSIEIDVFENKILEFKTSFISKATVEGQANRFDERYLVYNNYFTFIF